MGKDVVDIAREISNRVFKELGFTVNIGIAHNKLLAKMASDFEKPNKIHTLFEDEIKTKMWPLPCSELFMLGRKTVPKLMNMQIKTIGDIANTDKNMLIKNLGKHGQIIWEYANGIDNSEVNTKYEPPKSIGNSITLPRDLERIEDIEPIILALCEKVSFRLRKHKMVANVINIQLRTNQFVDYSHQKKLKYATSNTKDFIELSKEILKEMYKKEPIRLVGLRADNLESEEEIQLSLFSEIDNKQNSLDKTIDSIVNKYGIGSITRAGKLKTNIEYKSNK